MSGSARRFSDEEERFFAKLFSSQTSPEEREDSLNKYEALVQMLLAAGYFRTRISTLSPFDKARGGGRGGRGAAFRPPRTALTA